MRISVVIPLYNKAHTIVATLATVMAQSYTNFEVIVVNDGSTDGGAELIKNSFNDNRIRIINQKNRGPSAARNRGIIEACGEWVAFLDGDDRWHVDYLSTIVKASLQFPDAGMICTAGICENLISGEVSYIIATKYISRTVCVDFFENPEVFSQTSRLVINKQILMQIGGFNEDLKCCEDYLVSQKAALVSKFVYIGLPLSKYVGGVQGQITSIAYKRSKEMFVSVVKYYNYIYNFYLQNKNHCLFPVYIKYSLRTRFKNYLLFKCQDKLEYLLHNLDKDLISVFPKWEKSLYEKQRILSLIWIYITILIWRLHRFPRMGEQVKINKIPVEYRRW